MSLNKLILFFSLLTVAQLVSCSYETSSDSEIARGKLIYENRGRNNYLLRSNTCLRYDDERISPNGCFRLVFEWNGNLVVYRQRDNRAIWESNTFGSGGHRACMQSDGNFVIYTAGNGVVFETRTSGNHGSNAHIQNDGNFVIYRAAGGHSWASQRLSQC